MVVMLSLEHHAYQINSDFNKNKKYIKSSKLDQIYREGSILIWNIWFYKKKKIEKNNLSWKIKIKSIKNKSDTKIYYLDLSI